MASHRAAMSAAQPTIDAINEQGRQNLAADTVEGLVDNTPFVGAAKAWIDAFASPSISDFAMAAASSIPGGALAKKAADVTEMGQALAKKIGRNRVSVVTPKHRIDIDLAGKPHYDKVTGKDIPTPHVKETRIAVGENGLRSLATKKSKYRPATIKDIRMAEKAEKEGVGNPDKGKGDKSDPISSGKKGENPTDKKNN